MCHSDPTPSLCFFLDSTCDAAGLIGKGPPSWSYSVPCGFHRSYATFDINYGRTLGLSSDRSSAFLALAMDGEMNLGVQDILG